MEYLDFCICDVDKQYDLTVDSIYYVFADKDYIISHFPIKNSYVFVASLSGKGIINLNDKDYELTSGKVLIFDAKTNVFRYHCADVSWNFWWFEFKANSIEEYSLPIGVPFDSPLDSHQLFMCEEALNCLKIKDKHAASSLLSSVLSLLKKKEDTYCNRTNNIELFRKADKYIRYNLSTVTVGRLSEYLSVSDHTLLNIFRTLLGIRTVEYIQNMKTDMAKHLLLTSGKSIKSISEQLGYTDQFVFSKCFSKRFGVSPNDYRNSNS